MTKAPFHISLPCKSISKTREFYSAVLGSELGRNSHQWVDIDLFGNQITFTKAGHFDFTFKSYKFEETVLPSFHFGVIVDRETWNSLYHKLRASEYEITASVTFLKEKPGEHESFFIADPNGYSIEFKSFKNQDEMFEL